MPHDVAQEFLTCNEASVHELSLDTDIDAKERSVAHLPIISAFNGAIAHSKDAMIELSAAHTSDDP